MDELKVLDELQLEITDANSILFSSFDPDDVIELLDAVPRASSYHFVPSDVAAIWNMILARFGERGFEAFQQATLLKLIKAFKSGQYKDSFSDDIKSMFRRSFIRIVELIRNARNEGRLIESYRSVNDILLKDLAICRQKIFPAGAQVVEPFGAFQRRILVSGGFAQAVRFLDFLWRSGGNHPWYQIHTHLSEREDFNPEGWSRCYVRIASMLKLHPEIKGMYGGSWFYDPELARVSPRLAYLRQIPQDNGAQVFYSNDDLDGGALSTSETRRMLYKSGKYFPKAYLLAWPRDAMMRWAESYVREHPASDPNS